MTDDTELKQAQNLFKLLTKTITVFSCIRENN